VAQSSARNKSGPTQAARSRPQATKQQQAQTKARAPLQQAASTRAVSSSTKAQHLGTFTVRAYTQYPSLHKGPGKTATGTHPTPGRTIAVDPKVIPFGTKIYIEGVGERIAEDRGGSIKGKQIDVFLPTVEHCRRFGRQLRSVQVMVE
jgi:3D (Asp-Asp-Asp) domain-containing protein